MKKKIKELNAPQPVLNTVLALLALCALLPLILIVIVSFSSRESISANGFTFFPSSWSLEGWQYVFQYGAQVGQSYLVTIYENRGGHPAHVTVHQHVFLCAQPQGLGVARRADNFLAHYHVVFWRHGGQLYDQHNRVSSEEQPC